MNIGIGEERGVIPNVSANPPAKITWYSPSGDELPGNELKLKGEPGQDGVYKILAVNPYGEDEGTVKVSIKSTERQLNKMLKPILICSCFYSDTTRNNSRASKKTWNKRRRRFGIEASS